MVGEHRAGYRVGVRARRGVRFRAVEKNADGDCWRPVVSIDVDGMIRFVQAAERHRNGDHARHPELDPYPTWTAALGAVERGEADVEVALKAALCSAGSEPTGASPTMRRSLEVRMMMEAV